MTSIQVIKKQKKRERPSIKIRRPFKDFIRTEEFSGILLILCTSLALIIANTQLAHQYFELWETYLSVSFGGFILEKPLHLWINDGLMAIFFFVVGLEIKREILVGELKSPKKAILPISAALGGMIVPALIYSIINIANPSAARGWGIPMATDIAFVIGIMALLGTRVPFSLKIFLTSLAIVDDIGAVMIIALFYSQDIEYTYLVIAGLLLLGLFLINRFEIQHHLVYAIIGFFLWYLIFLSGMHATIAGILIAITIPARTRINPNEFVADGQLILERFKSAGPRDKEILLNRQHLAALKTLELTCLNVQTPLQRFERGLHYWVAFAIVPLFILSNAGITVEVIDPHMFFQPITLGIMLGLVFGKQIGIFLFAWISVKLGLTELPSGLTWGHIYGGAWLGGIGFTMSLFIASLALIDPNNLIMAKIGIITGSLISGVIGYLILRYIHTRISLERSNSE
ncbi:MAG: Na+/H+ antiporter NhaA [Candidatus Hodarchaeota archaeon]